MDTSAKLKRVQSRMADINYKLQNPDKVGLTSNERARLIREHGHLMSIAQKLWTKMETA